MSARRRVSAKALREALEELQYRLVAGIYDGSFDCHAALEIVDGVLGRKDDVAPSGNGDGECPF